MIPNEMLRYACVFLFGLAAIAADASGPQAPPAGESTGRGSLAVLRRDGIMFPFAAFDSDRWKITWPVPLPTHDVPKTIDAIPERWWGVPASTPWRARLMDGRERPLALEALLVFEAFCAKRFGIRTNYRSDEPLPPAPVRPFPKDGLAIAGDVSVDPIESLDDSSPEWSGMTAALVKDFDRVEKETAARVRMASHWDHPIPEKERQKLPIQLESWYRSPSGDRGWTVSYVEAVRKYPPRAEDGACGLETVVSGWVHHQDGQLKASELRGKITYCDRVGVTYMLPFGRIKPKERSYWVFQLSGWEHEWYDVVEVGPKQARFVVEVYAGGERACR